jgi:Tfp pilus assembly protein PilF
LGHQELIAEPDMSGYTPPQEEGLREGAKANISGRVDKKSASKNWNLGVIYFQKGDKRGARDAWTRCLELDPGNADCRTGLERVGGPAGPPRGDSAKAGREYAAGMRFLMSGQKAKAAAAFKRCLAADAAHKDCAQGLERVR